MTLDPLALDDYALLLEAWHHEIETFCRQRGIHYTPVNTDTPWEKIITQSLREQGVIL